MRHITATPEKTTARKKFQRYKPEKTKTVRTAKVKEKRILTELRSVWERINRQISLSEGEGTVSEKFEKHFLGKYEKAVDAFSRLDYDARDITTCLIIMSSEFRDVEGARNKNKGLLLSALINCCRDDSPVTLEDWQEEICYIGFRNRKIIIVNGFLDAYAGEEMEGGLIHAKGGSEGFGILMKGGRIIVEGNVDDADGFGDRMRGGEIIIRGDVAGLVGPKMEGGRIDIFGNVTKEALGERSLQRAIGGGMKGGEIHLHGGICKARHITEDAYEDIRTSVIHGRVYHKGKLIIDK